MARLVVLAVVEIEAISLETTSKWVITEFYYSEIGNHHGMSMQSIVSWLIAALVLTLVLAFHGTTRAKPVQGYAIGLKAANRRLNSPHLRPTAIASQPTGANKAECTDSAADLDRVLASGDDNAIFALARKLERGKIGSRDLAGAAKLMLAAARLGNPDAMLRYGIYVERGFGTEPNFDQAVYWFELAARSGRPDGLAGIARLFMEGRLVAADLNVASMYIDKAETAGSGEALFLKALLSPSSTAETIALLRRGAELGNENSKMMLARLYADGVPGEDTYDAALDWARSAASEGSPDAETMLAKILLKVGPIGEQSDVAWIDEVKKNFYDAAQQGSAVAATELARLLLMQKAISANEVKELRDLATAAYDLSMPDAAFLMAASYAIQGDHSNDKEILAWLKLGAKDQDWRSKYARRLLSDGTIEPSEAVRIAGLATLTDYSQAEFERRTRPGAKRPDGVMPPAPISITLPTPPVGFDQLSLSENTVAEFTVGRDGSPVAIQVSGTRFASIEARTIQSVSTWRFKPATRNGEYYALKVRVPIRFYSGR